MDILVYWIVKYRSDMSYCSYAWLTVRAVHSCNSWFITVSAATLSMSESKAMMGIVRTFNMEFNDLKKIICLRKFEVSVEKIQFV